MANIFTRKAIGTILADEGLTAEEKTERVFGLYGQALDDGYTSKSAAQAAQKTALDAAKAEWEKSIQKPDIKASDEYKALQGEFDAYKAMQTARASAEFSTVKPKFFETVYGMIDRNEGAKDLKDQLTDIRAAYEEYFTVDQPEDKPAAGQKNTPQYSQQAKPDGINPTSEEDKLYKQLSESWGK